MDHVSITKEGRIATIRFDRDTKSNALSLGLMRELTDAARSFEDDHSTAAIILTGHAECFSMGFDLRDPETLALRDKPLSEQRVALDLGARMCRAWDDAAPLTIAAIEGWCLGGGLALAAACDLRVAARSAKLALPEIERGFTLSWGTIPRTVNLVGPARAKRMILLAERVSAETALEWGLVDELADAGDTLAAAQTIAETAARMPPNALRAGKRSINAYAAALAAATTHVDADLFALALNSQDGAEGLTAFAERRTPEFKGS